MDTASCLLAFIGWFFGGVAGGAAGMGAGMVALPITAIHIDVRIAVMASLITGTVSAFHLFFSYRKHARRSDLKDILLAGAPFCAVGTLLLKVLPKSIILLSIAGTIMVFVLLKLFLSPDRLRLPDKRWPGILAGAATGLCQGANSMSGPPIAVYVLLRKWDPNRARGNMSIVFTIICSLTLGAFLIEGMLSREIFILALSGTAGMFLGQPLGVRLGRNMPGRTFERLLLCLLSLAAMSMFAKAVL